VALNGGRFFTEKSTQFLYASPQRPELIIGGPGDGWTLLRRLGYFTFSFV
jgi:hypothetical protein